MSAIAQLSPRERIIRSLFNEKDESGTMLEQYITHVKIFEDAQYPSEPPPQPTPAENLKERYILLSVKKNGRVRMHKSRGNDNGTFQIGKTWNLEDLQKIEDTDRRGLIVTLLKPYYWTMDSVKEKYMFVSALTKVYKKYTGGRMFDMVNFDTQHLPASERLPALGTQSRQERSVSAQAPAGRTPQQISPLRTQRSVSEFREPVARDQIRQASISSNTTSTGPVPPSPGIGPVSRVTSSQYGGPTDRTSLLHNVSTSPPIPRSQQRSVSSSIDERTRRGAVPFASPPLSQHGNPTLNGIASRLPEISTKDLSGRIGENQSDNLGSPMSFTDSRAAASPVPERPPEKSLRRQAIESPISELAPALRAGGPPPEPSRVMSPPAPAKSPARRPSNVRTSSGGSHKILHERLTGMISPAESIASSPAAHETPSIPTKSGARSSEIAKPVERMSVPWQTPMERPRSEDYFGSNGVQDRTAAVMTTTEQPTVEQSLGQDNPKEDTMDREEDQVLLNDDNTYIEEILKDFKWSARNGASVLSRQVQNELSLLEAANIHAIMENDNRLEDLMAKLDKGIAQCQDMDNLLTIYEFEMATASEDIKHIEGQSQGLQVQTANQVALIEEILRVLDSITISDGDLDVLKGRGGNLESLEGISNIEKSLINLYRALKSMRDERTRGQETGMSAMNFKNKEYMADSSAFLSRLDKYLQIKFQAALLSTVPQSVSRIEPPMVLQGHDDGFMSLAPYAALMLYAREIEVTFHSNYMKAYALAAKSSWQDPILNFIGQWKAHARRATVEESDLMFTASRDQQSTGATRTATLKRTNTLAKQIRSVTSTSKPENGASPSKMPAGEVFRTILDNFVLLLSNEQNFMVAFFHLSSFGSYEYADYVELDVKSRLTVASLDDHKPTEPNRNLAKERYLLMDSIFGWTSGELLSLIDYLAGLDSIQTVGMIKSLEVVLVEWADSDQEFMLRTLNKLKDRAGALLHNFIEIQVRAIKDTKVTSKKRKGIIPVFEIFPDVVERIEIQLSTSDSSIVSTSQLEVRHTINMAYERMSKAMFESVRTIASSASVTSQGLVDPEDKEVLNYHILMVQNMYQYLEALQSRNNAILEDFRTSAQKQYSDHLKSYTRQIITRPIGRIIDFTEAFEKHVQEKGDISSKALFSQTSVKRLLNDHDERDMRKGISAMWKRVDKHYSDDDGNATALLSFVWKTTQQDYLALVDRFMAILQTHYSEVRVDWSRQILNGAFAKRET